MLEKTPEDQYVQVGEINTRYWSLGEGDQVIILIHGIGCAVEMWELNFNALAEHYRVYALDMVGYGRTDKPEVEYNLPLFAQFIRDFMQTQSINRASLIGLSLGGAVSLQFAIQFPEKLDRLILSGSGGLGKEINLMFRLATIPIIGEVLMRPSLKGTKRFLKECVYDTNLLTDELVELYYQMGADQPALKKSFLNTLRTLAKFGGIKEESFQPILDMLPNIKVPTLIIWGKQDRILPVDHAYIAEKGIPNAQVKVLDPCGHLSQHERPEDFNSIVLEFLADNKE